MKIDFERLKEAFPTKAWAYAEQYDSVKIGKWESGAFTFYEPLEEDYLLLLRVFDGQRELRFTDDKFRDTAIYRDEDFIPELADAQYYMYGKYDEYIGEYTKLYEDRGGIIYFPAMLDFNDKGLKLGIRNYVRYNPVFVVPKGQAYDFGLNTTGAGALEVVDYAYTGFFYINGNEVQL